MEIDSILFIDIEATNDKKIQEIGLCIGKASCKTTSMEEALRFVLSRKRSIKGVCGHNIFDYDLEIIKNTPLYVLLFKLPIIDTLPLSLLLFSEKTFHNLPKEYKSEDNFKNDPLKDALLTKDLLQKCIERFSSLDFDRQRVLYTLLNRESKFLNFFFMTGLIEPVRDLSNLLRELYPQFKNISLLQDMIKNNPIELAYIIALSTPAIEIKAHPPKILYEYPHLPELHERLTLGEYKEEELFDFMYETFGFAGFREFPRFDPKLHESPFISQKEIVEAALKKESFLAVLPTGGGKTFSFWLPALFRAQKIKALTVVISPLQALIQDHLKSFQNQVANFTAVAISGYQNSIERADAMEKVVSGEADILYLAPESLRSESIFSILKNRLIDRFVIDEAHCLSTWGHDFRQDYFYIAEFILDILRRQPWQDSIPVSCFTATAKLDVINDIKNYFEKRLSISIREYLAKPDRSNLRYEAKNISTDGEKYLKLLQILQHHPSPALVYIPTSTAKCDEIADRLSLDLDKRVSSFHSKLSSEKKSMILREYLNDEIDVVIATTAFGMGVDKPNIKTVIHYVISDSLENYVQEAGRGARNKDIEAFCPLLFNESDLDRHFLALNRNKLSVQEINAVFRVIKNEKGSKILLSEREIAQKAGWDIDGSDESWRTKIKTALLELEREGYLERKRNKIRYFADAVAKEAYEKLHKLYSLQKLDSSEYELLVQVLNVIMGRGKPRTMQIDEIAFILDIKREKIAFAILRLKELGILTDAKDMVLFVFKDALERIRKIIDLEKALYKKIASSPMAATTIRSLHNYLININVIDQHENYSAEIKEILKSWMSTKNFHFRRIDRQNDIWEYSLKNRNLIDSIERKHLIYERLILYFLNSYTNKRQNRFSVEFSLVELSKELGFTVKEVDKALFYLHQMKIVELSSGRFIYYAPMQIFKTDKFEKKRRYTLIEYGKRMHRYYKTKTESIHIVGEFAKKLLSDPVEAQAFMRDYFSLNYEKFKRKYRLTKISHPITKKRFDKIFGSLTEEQKAIINDQEHGAIMVLAGPGSGKTKVLVHKIASLLLKEDTKPQDFLMLTFSQAAASEFRQRLYDLIGEMARDVEIKTFHGYALQLIGREIDDDNDTLLQEVIEDATLQIKEGKITIPFKSVLMLDEFQDINEKAFRFIEAIFEAQEESMRIIAVGDDDQCILSSINKADIVFFERFKERFGNVEGGYKEYKLLKNFRSTPQILECAQIFLKNLQDRKKRETLLATKPPGEKVEIIVTSSLIPAATAYTDIKVGKKTAFLAFTNNEVELLYSYLYERGHNPKYLLSGLGFRLKNIAELYDLNRYIQSYSEERILTERVFEEGFGAICQKYSGSKKLHFVEKVIERFLQEHKTPYLTMWQSFLQGLDFYNFEENADIVTSTMHKSKGKEFDQVTVLIPEREHTGEWLRLLFVAATRAKESLKIVTEDVEIAKALETTKSSIVLTNSSKYREPSTLTYLMTLKDVNLGRSPYSALSSSQVPVAGETVQLKKLDGRYVFTYNNRIIEYLSKDFSKKLQKRFLSGWTIKEIKVEAIVYWKDKISKTYLPHLLAKVILQK